MKISAITAFTQRTLNNGFQSNAQMTAPTGLKTLSADTVSFKGCKENNSVTESFGLIKKFGKKSDLNSIFKISHHINDEGKKIIDTFELDSQFGKVKFFGNEKRLAEHLKKNKNDISLFDVIATEKDVEISYTENNLRYKLKYSKDTHELVRAASVYLEADGENNRTVERFVLYPSSKNPDTYAAQYHFIEDINGESAVDITDIAFDSDLNVRKTQSSKSFYYSDGAKAESDFEQIYDKDTGSVETIDGKLSPKIY